MPMTLFSAFLLVLVLSEFGLPGMLPLVVLPLDTSLFELLVGYLLVLIPIFHCHSHHFFGKGSNIRCNYIITLFFSFLMVFMSSQSDIY